MSLNISYTGNKQCVRVRERLLTHWRYCCSIALSHRNTILKFAHIRLAPPVSAPWKRKTDLGSNSFFIMTSSNGNIFRVTGHLGGESTGHRWIPRTKTSDAELLMFPLICTWNHQPQSWGWWFEMTSSPLWRHCNVWSIGRDTWYISSPFRVTTG